MNEMFLQPPDDWIYKLLRKLKEKSLKILHPNSLLFIFYEVNQFLTIQKILVIDRTESWKTS